MIGTVLVLDAMGVIYASADDVAELLILFVAENGGICDTAEISRQYTSASLGEISADDFWKNVQLSPDVEDKYLARHRLTKGLLSFLDDLPPCVSDVWCLSNDVSEWSRKLRLAHALEDRFAGFVVSGDVGVRKPDCGIYERLLSAVGQPANSLLLIDDRFKNLDAAQALGIQTIYFNTSDDPVENQVYTRVNSFVALSALLNSGSRKNSLGTTKR